jgi:hypothetical protein
VNRERTKQLGAPVVFVWAGFMAVLTVIHVFYGGGLFPLGLIAGDVTLSALFGLAVVVSQHRHELPVARYRMLAGGEAAVVGAIACLFGGLAVVFGFWFVPLVAFPLLAAGMLAFRRRSGPQPRSAPTPESR